MRLCLAIALMVAAVTNAPLTRVHSDETGDDFLISCRPGPLKADYRAETASGVSLSDPYAVARGADKGLVRLMYRDGARVKRFVVSRRLILSLVTVKLDQTAPDKVDMLYLATRLMVIHTSTSNAGIFTASDVYMLPFDKTGHIDGRTLKQAPDLWRSVRLGLSFYQAHIAACSRW